MHFDGVTTVPELKANSCFPLLWLVAKFTPSIVIVQNFMINKILQGWIMMYTYKHICNVLSQRYQNDTIQYPSRKRSCVFSMEGCFRVLMNNLCGHKSRRASGFQVLHFNHQCLYPGGSGKAK